MNFILEGNLKQMVLYTYSTIMNFILEGKLCFTETKRLCRITLLNNPSTVPSIKIFYNEGYCS